MVTLASMKRPSSDAEVFDLLQTMFGIGDWNETDEEPWHKVKMREAAKIRAIRRKRQMALEDFALTAEYCRRKRIFPTSAWDLLTHYGKAKLEAIQQRRAQPSRLDEEIAEAVANERSRLDVDELWVGRLLRASGPGRQVALDEWRDARG